jgi:hypothetical protein
VSNNKKLKAYNDNYERHQKQHKESHEIEITSQDSFLKKFSLMNHSQQNADNSSQRNNSDLIDQMAKERTPNSSRKTKVDASLPKRNAAHSPSQSKRVASHERNIEEEDSSLGPENSFYCKTTDESSRMLEHSVLTNNENTDTLASDSTYNMSGVGGAGSDGNLKKSNESAGRGGQNAPQGTNNKKHEHKPNHNQNSKKKPSVISRSKHLTKKSITGISSIGSSVSSLNSKPSKSGLKSYMTRFMIKLNYFVLSPDDNTMFAWLIILNMCVLYNIWLIIARQSFEKLQIFYREYWIIADYVVDAIYALDILVQFRTGYLEQGLLVYNSKKLAINYSRSRNFLLDVFALAPLEIIQWKLQYDLPILRFPRFFKCYRTIDFYYMTESRTLYPNVWRVANLTHILFLLGHWFAGFYFLLSKAEGFKGKNEKFCL